MLIVGVPMVLVEVEVVELAPPPFPEKANAAPAPAAATAVQISHFLRPEWLEKLSGELEMETEDSVFGRSALAPAELDFEKLEIETDGRAGGITAGADAIGASEAATPGTGAIRGYELTDGVAGTSSPRGTGGGSGATAADILSSKSRPAWLFPLVAVILTGTEPELAIQRMPSTWATPDPSV
jgi:hypothetical protein